MKASNNDFVDAEKPFKIPVIFVIEKQHVTRWKKVWKNLMIYPHIGQISINYLPGFGLYYRKMPSAKISFPLILNIFLLLILF